VPAPVSWDFDDSVFLGLLVKKVGRKVRLHLHVLGDDGELPCSCSFRVDWEVAD
jgi:hypothetical protein